MPPRHPHRQPPRRTLLKTLAAGAGALLVGTAGSGCTPPVDPDDPEYGENKAPSGPPSPPVALPLAHFTPGQHVTVMVGDHPVEVIRTAEGVTARSLLCTHWGCVVTWVPADRRYACFCHKGLFDADGRVIGGAATKPMLIVPARIEGDTVIVGAEVATKAEAWRRTEPGAASGTGAGA